MCKCVFKFYLVSMQRKIVEHTDIYNYNHEVLKMNSSLLSIISVLLWRSGKQFWALKKKNTKAQPLSFEAIFTGCHCDNTHKSIEQKRRKKIYIYTNIYIRITIFIFCIDPSIPSFVEIDNFIFKEFLIHGFKILIDKLRIQLSLKNG